MVLIHSGVAGPGGPPSLVYELSRSHSGPGVQIQHAHTPSSSRGYSCLVSGFQPCGTLQSCHPTTHREVRSVSCPPPHHLQECWPEPPLSARVGGGSVPPQPCGGTAQECSNAAVVVPRSTRFSRRFARFPVEPPASARRRQGDSTAPFPEIGTNCISRSEVGWPVSRREPIDIRRGLPPKWPGAIWRGAGRSGAIWRGRAPFGAEPGGRAPFGAAGRHLRGAGGRRHSARVERWSPRGKCRSKVGS